MAAEATTPRWVRLSGDEIGWDFVGFLQGAALAALDDHGLCDHAKRQVRRQDGESVYAGDESEQEKKRLAKHPP